MRMREMGPSAVLPPVNEMVSLSPSSQPARHPVNSNVNGKGAFVKHGTAPLHRHQRQHAVIKTPPRSLGDDLESTVSMATSTATTVLMASPPRTSSSTRAVSPKLSPISHASSTTRQQEQRHRQKDMREPPSPFQLQQQVDESKTSSLSNNDSQTVTSRSQAESQPRVAIHDGSASISNDDTESDDFVDLTDLFILLQRRDWQNVYGFLIKHPNSSRQTIHSKKGTSPLLHIVLRHAPPLPVLNVLLSQEAAIDRTGRSSPDVWKQTDTSGRFPLHVACSCGPDAYLDVVSRLISADPEALRMRSKDEHGRFPLHMAVVTDASEDVVMELMINYPDASFIPDAHGKIPIEYAQDSCHGHNRLVVALEWAPMFLAASQAASNRISKDTETKLNSLREAHAAYEEQLEDRYNDEKMALVREHIRCSDDLAIEKERNIALAEAMLGMTKTKEDLIRERDRLKSKLDRERLVRKRTMKARDEELKQILLGVSGNKDMQKGNKAKGGEEAGGDKDGTDGGDGGAAKGGDASSSDVSLPTLLKRISQGYDSSKRRNELYKKHLERQRATNQKLTAALAQKETELKQAHRNSHNDQAALQSAIDRAEDLALQHETAVAKLSAAREEVERLRRMGAERDQKLSHSERRLRIQGKRLSGINDLIDSLKAAKETQANRLDRIQEEGGAPAASAHHDDPSGEAVHLSSGAKGGRRLIAPKADDLSVDLSVEIEMAAMAAAHLDDSTSSGKTTQSARRREADLSAELAAAVAPDQTRPAGEERSTPEPMGTTRRETRASANRHEPAHRSGSKWDRDKGAKRVESTPKTVSSNTVTTASFGDDGFDDDRSVRDRGMPETPPVPQHVKSRCRREYDQCSPLSSPKLNFVRDSLAL